MNLEQMQFLYHHKRNWDTTHREYRWLPWQQKIFNGEMTKNDDYLDVLFDDIDSFLNVTSLSFNMISLATTVS